MDSSNSSNNFQEGGNTKTPSLSNPDTRDNESDRKTQISPAKGWAITIFEFPEDWKTWISSRVPDCEGKYIFGLEKCPNSGNMHLQGYIHFEKKCRAFNKIKDWLGESVHIEKARKPQTNNVKYCSKDGDYISTFKVEKKKWHTFEDYIDDFKDCTDLRSSQLRMARLMLIDKKYCVIMAEKRRLEICEMIWRYNTESDRFNEVEETFEEKTRRLKSLEMISFD
jgi:hypothetical protein